MSNSKNIAGLLGPAIVAVIAFPMDGGYVPEAFSADFQ